MRALLVLWLIFISFVIALVVTVAFSKPDPIGWQKSKLLFKKLAQIWISTIIAIAGLDGIIVATTR
uniref:Photosystem II reaction center protein Z n=1 Tax=Astrosyne radiata TaxID=1158023 RepID=A0A2U9NTR3_9STRA|nr:photosystem II protein Z [Astrosyne radiata]AWT40276.1 photosystem II protein Z [Astrosyne radiata]